MCLSAFLFPCLCGFLLQKEMELLRNPCVDAVSNNLPPFPPLRLGEREKTCHAFDTSKKKEKKMKCFLSGTCIRKERLRLDHAV